MEENNNKKCECLWCRSGCGKHQLLRWIIGLLILWAVFALGVKVGELKYMIKDGLRGGYYGYNKSGYFPNMMNSEMMNFWSNQLQSATSTR